VLISEFFATETSNPYKVSNEVSVERKPEKFSKFRAIINYCVDLKLNTKLFWGEFSESIYFKVDEKAVHGLFKQKLTGKHWKSVEGNKNIITVSEYGLQRTLKFRKFSEKIRFWFSMM
jgi:hypothetical protein